MAAVSVTTRPFMSVKQVAEYLSLNEKKVYTLVNEGRIPGTKVTGKWMFPRELVDRWMLESSHGGVLTDRLVIMGSDDPLLFRLTLRYAQEIRAHALVSYTASNTRLGLDMLQANRVDAACMHWGPSAESRTRHPALLRQYSQYRRWVLVHAFRREQGLMAAPCKQVGDTEDAISLLSKPFRWVMREQGSGAQRYLREIQSQGRLDAAPPDVVATVNSDREAAALIAMGQGDIAPGARATANEFGLDFVAFGWESFDIAMRKDIYFRRLFQDLIRRLHAPETLADADRLGGYDLSNAGHLVFGAD